MTTSAAGSTAPSPQPTPGRSILPSIGSLISIIAVLTSITYILLHHAYTTFYDAFGVTPEEIGQDRADILAQAALGLTILIVQYTIYASVLLAIILFSLALVVAWRIIAQGERRKKWRDEILRLGRLAIRALPVFIAIALVFALTGAWWYLHRVAEFLGKQAVDKGWVIAPLRFSDVDMETLDVFGWRPLGIAGVKIMDLRAEAITTATPSSVAGLPPALRGDRRRCSLYLGTANGVIVLYDVSAKRVVRLPTTLAAIEYKRPLRFRRHNQSDREVNFDPPARFPAAA